MIVDVSVAVFVAIAHSVHHVVAIWPAMMSVSAELPTQPEKIGEWRNFEKIKELKNKNAYSSS